MTELYILCGLPFSGKTFLAERIREHSEAEVISFDDVYSEKMQEFEKEQLPIAERWQRVKTLAIERVEEHLKNGQNAIWDSTNPLRRHREELREIANRHNANSHVIFVNTPLRDIYVRIEGNRATEKRHNIDSVDFSGTLEKWENPSEDENAIEFCPGDDIVVFLKKLS